MALSFPATLKPPIGWLPSGSLAFGLGLHREKLKWPPLPTVMSGNGRDMKVAQRPRFWAISFTPVLNVVASSAAAMPNFGAKVISSWPWPYSAFIVFTSTPAASMLVSIS